MGCKLYIYKRVGDGDKKGSRIKERRKSRKEIR